MKILHVAVELEPGESRHQLVAEAAMKAHLDRVTVQVQEAGTVLGTIRPGMSERDAYAAIFHGMLARPHDPTLDSNP